MPWLRLAALRHGRDLQAFADRALFYSSSLIVKIEALTFEALGCYSTILARA
jgi:hypothetical protein